MTLTLDCSLLGVSFLNSAFLTCNSPKIQENSSFQLPLSHILKFQDAGNVEIS